MREDSDSRDLNKWMFFSLTSHDSSGSWGHTEELSWFQRVNDVLIHLLKFRALLFLNKNSINGNIANLGCCDRDCMHWLVELSSASQKSFILGLIALAQFKLFDVYSSKNYLHSTKVFLHQNDSALHLQVCLFWFPMIDFTGNDKFTTLFHFFKNS